MSRASKIIAIATSYIGNIEKKGNQGFFNADFEKKLRGVGFYTGAPWCAFFTKLVYMEAYADNKALRLCVANNSNGSALETLRNHENNGTFAISEVPKPGAIVVWRMGTGKSGHHGIVVSVDLKTNTMTTIEGNTNASGSREGDRVAQKLRTVTRDFQTAGLNVEGYILPFEI